jgi:ribosomal protein S18 acetylase RimI-like enzyme
MKVRKCRDSDLPGLFEYWRKVGTGIPYFFPVSAARWEDCLLEDELDGERVFRSLEVYVATEDGQILGFAQFGQPNLAWDRSGQKCYEPQIGVLRHLYFEEGCQDAGAALLAKACGHLAGFRQIHAFYHILGMSCNAYHGKLHDSLSHVDQLLLAHDFRIEHENAYYVLDAECITPVADPQLHFSSIPGTREESFEICLAAEVVGTARLRILDTLTGGCTRDTAYLTWIGVAERHRNQGVGTRFMKQLAQLLSSRQLRYLHTDTASGNLRAQRFFEKLGFRKEGYTRSYIRVQGSFPVPRGAQGLRRCRKPTEDPAAERQPSTEA